MTLKAQSNLIVFLLFGFLIVIFVILFAILFFVALFTFFLVFVGLLLLLQLLFVFFLNDLNLTCYFLIPFLFGRYGLVYNWRTKPAVFQVARTEIEMILIY